MQHPEPLKQHASMQVDISSPTMYFGTFMQVRIPKQDCSVANPAYHLLEISINEDGVTTIHATPGTPEVQIWEDES